MQACGELIGWSGEFVRVTFQGNPPRIIEHLPDCMCEFCCKCRSSREGVASQTPALDHRETSL